MPQDHKIKIKRDSYTQTNKKTMHQSSGALVNIRAAVHWSTSEQRCTGQHQSSGALVNIRAAVHWSTSEQRCTGQLQSSCAVSDITEAYTGCPP